MRTEDIIRYCCDKFYDAYHGLRHIENSDDLYTYIYARFKLEHGDYEKKQVWLCNAIDAYYSDWTVNTETQIRNWLSFSFQESYLLWLSDYYPKDWIESLARYFQTIRRNHGRT